MKPVGDVPLRGGPGPGYTALRGIVGSETPRLLVVTEVLADVWDELELPSGFAVRQLHDWQEAVAAARREPFDVILTTFPLGHAPFQEVLDALRSPGSASYGAGLVALASPGRLDEAHAFLGRGLSRVLDSAVGAAELGETIRRLAAVSPRARARLPVTLVLPIGGRQCRIRTFTENISASGMLLGTSNRLEVGQKVAFELCAPDSGEEVRGFAEVVRHTREGRDRVNGIGLRFLEVEDAERERLARLVERRLE